MTDKLMTPVEWAALSAESRAAINKYGVEYEAMKERIAELEEERRWIPVSERLPDDDCVVMVYFSDGYQSAMPKSMFDDDITHWKPLSQPPEVSE